MAKRAKIGLLIRTVAFLLCMAIVFVWINSIVSHAKETVPWVSEFRIREIYNVDANSVDVLSLGSSMSICSFSPMDLYRDYGISAYNAGIEQQPIVDSYLILNEILKRQKPRVLLLEVYCLFYDGGENYFRKSFDGVKWSEEKWKVLHNLSQNYLDDSSWNYIFPILKFHTRYKEISKTDFVEASRSDQYTLFMGYSLMRGTYSPKEPMVPLRPDETAYEQPDEQAIEYLQKIISLCKEHDVELILYKTPVDIQWSTARYNSVKQLAEEKEIPYIDFNLEEIVAECGFDFALDQYSSTHQNSSGAVKLTQYLGKYLHENYDLPDRRGDPAYAYLDQELERYEREKFNEQLIQTTDLSSYLDLLLEADSGYTAIISVRDDAFKGLDEELRGKLKRLGFQSDLTSENAYRHSWIGVWENGRVVYEKLSKGIDDPERDVLEFRNSLPDGMKYYVKSAGWSAGNASSIIIDGAEKSKNSRGLNIVVYDSVSGRVVDSIVFDTYKDAGITYKR